MKNKKYIYIIAIIIIILCITLYFKNKNYDIFLNLYMPSDSYGYIKYSPSNQNEFNLYKGSALNIEYIFSDNKKRKIKYVISNEDIIEIKNDKIYTKENGSTTIYIKTKDNIKSNIININVVNDNE